MLHVGAWIEDRDEAVVKWPSRVGPQRKRQRFFQYVGLVQPTASGRAAARSIQAVLVGIDAFDTMTFVGAVMILVLVTMAAGVIPARRVASDAALGCSDRVIVVPAAEAAVRFDGSSVPNAVSA